MKARVFRAISLLITFTLPDLWMQQGTNHWFQRPGGTKSCKSAGTNSSALEKGGA